MRTEQISSAQVTQSNKTAKVLKNGESVLVRVVSYKGNGKYEGSVAGIPVKFTAKNPLQIGQSFVAVVNNKNGVIELAPKLLDSLFESSSFLNKLNDSQITQYLNNLGLIPDNLSFHLLKQLHQNKMELNSAVLNKIHNRALKFKNKEKSASEILLLLSQKGIEISDEELERFLQNYEDLENDELFKKINFIKKSWKLFPYEIKNKNNEIFGKGILKILCDEKNQLQKINVEGFYKKTNYKFLLNFAAQIPQEIFFNFSNVLSENNIKQETFKLKKIFSVLNANIKVNFVDSEKLDGFGADCESLYKIGGEV